MPDTSLVTIALPVFNAGRDLRLAVVSLLQQTFVDWELLLIDDGSTDDAIEGIRDLVDSRIRIFRDGTNKGLAARLNEAIDYARSPYFARMDQDDIAYPERLARQIGVMEADSRLDLVAVRCLTIDSTNAALGSLPFAVSHDDLTATPWKSIYLPHPTWLGRTAWFRRYRYAEPGPYCSEDQELLLRSYHSSRFATLPEILFAYRLRTKICLSKSWRTRMTIARIQWRSFVAAQQWHHAAMTVLSTLARVVSDMVDAATGGGGLRRQRAIPLSVHELERWQAVCTKVEAASMSIVQR